MDIHTLPSWLYTPTLEHEITGADSLDDFLSNNRILFSVLDNLNEGISVLAPDYSLLYANEYMIYHYPICAELEQLPFDRKPKCHKMYHDTNSPCIDCPMRSCIQEKKSAASVVNYSSPDQPDGKMIVHTSPIFDSNGEICLILEYVRNISGYEETFDNVDEIIEKNKLLEQQNRLLMETIAIKEKQYRELESTITKNMEQSVKPALQYLKKKVPEEDYSLVSAIIEQSLSLVSSQEGYESSLIFSSLSAREYQVASMIRDGLSSKEIAAKLFITKKAVDFHRSNLRKKLGVSSSENFQTYLKLHMPQ